MVGIARDPRDPFALQTVPVSAGPIDLRVLVAVRSLVVRGDARRTVRGLVIEPLEVMPAPPGFTNEVARRAVRYEPALSISWTIAAGQSRRRSGWVAPAIRPWSFSPFRPALGRSDAAQRAGREP